MDYKEISVIAKLHKTCLPNSHIGCLPARLVVGFYNNLLENSNFDVTLHRVDGEIKGVAVISKKGFGATKKMLPKVAYLFILVKNPIQIFQTLLNRNKDIGQENIANIEFLFVDSLYRSSGIGRDLLRSIMKSYDEICVSTRSSVDNRAIQFYLRNGFKPIGSQTVVGRELTVFRWES
jgi:ribosomal protein S18 acetylase RimI-like enzyme